MPNRTLTKTNPNSHNGSAALSNHRPRCRPPNPKKTPKALPYQPRLASEPTTRRPGGAPAPRPATAAAAALPESLRAPRPRPVDPNSPAYKAASRKYVRTMIAMPILLVTSWVLFDRLARGAEVKTFKQSPSTDQQLAQAREAGNGGSV
ncbi:uncharacterized protein PG986_002497 [Apiospora aurea]|uniref:Uncharacterized protein n=1 Tax=Apiospora aurea TaxID=335848 RepID=A0ABR1QP09_9PEZI